MLTVPSTTLPLSTDSYHQTVGRNAVLELDFAIDRTGRVDPAHAARYTEFGDWIRACYDTPVGSTSGKGASFVVQFNTTKIDRVVMREDQSQGQRVRAYTVEAQVDGVWMPLVTGDGIGNRRVDLHSTVVVATAVRLNITEAVAEPIISHFGAFSPCPTA